MSSNSNSDANSESEVSFGVYQSSKDPEEIGGEVVWVAPGRHGSDARYHTTLPEAGDDPHKPPDCAGLKAADHDPVPRSRERLEVWGMPRCGTCVRREKYETEGSLDSGSKAEIPCPEGCGEEIPVVALRHHLPCDGAGVRCSTCGEPFPSMRRMKIHHFNAHGEYAPESYSVCDECGRHFKIKWDAAGDYCSGKCQRKAQIVFASYTCEYCGRTKRAKPGDAKTRKYCSGACAKADRRDRVEVTCKLCGDTRESVRSDAGEFCSQACAHWYRWVAVYRGVRV